MSEEWKEIERGQYAVSSLGRVKRIRSDKPNTQRHIGKILAPGRGKYLMVSFGSRATRRTVKIHILVAEAFLGPRPAGKQINHKNGNKYDNRLENLEYVTPSENTTHAIGLGLGASRERHGNSKLTNEAVAEIRKFAKRGKLSVYADKFGVDLSTVCRVINDRSWIDSAALRDAGMAP